MRDINREQSRVTDLETELIAARTAYTNLQEKNKIESNLSEAQFSDLRERVGELNGKLQLTKSRNTQLNALLATKEEQLKEIITKLAVSETRDKNFSDKINTKKIQRFLASKRG